MDFIVNGILCETRPEQSREQKYRKIMGFLDRYQNIQNPGSRSSVQNSLRFTLGNNLRTIRDNLRFTQDEMGMVLGVNQSDISSMEHGNKLITTAEICRLFEFIPDVNAKVFFGYKSDLRRPTDLKYIYVCSRLNALGFEYLNEQLKFVSGISKYLI